MWRWSGEGKEPYARVAQSGTLLFRRLAVGRRWNFERLADCQSAIQPAASRRYELQTLNLLRVNAKHQHFILANEFTSDSHRLGHEFKHLLVHWFAVARDEEKVASRAIRFADEQHGWHSATDTTHRARAMRFELPRVHHAQE